MLLLPKLSRRIRIWILRVSRPKDGYGLTVSQRRDILWHARRGEVGRDSAERLALISFGMRHADFDRLLADHRIPNR